MLLAALEVAFHRPTPIFYNDVEFDFHVYCPLYYEPNLTRMSKPFWEHLPYAPQTLNKDPKLKKTYVVNIREVLT